MNRTAKIKKSLAAKEALLVSSASNIYYITGFNGFSHIEREAYTLITKRKNYIFTDGRYANRAKQLKGFEFIEISLNKKFKQAIKEIVDLKNIKRLAIETDNLTINELKQVKPVGKLTPANNILKDLRKIKDNSEINNIKKACKIGDKAFYYILTKLKIGVSEQQISKLIEIFLLENNANTSFSPIVAFGNNSALPHHVPGNKKLKKNNIVLLDFGVKVNNYCSDMTRTVFFGKASREQKQIYQTVYASQQRVFKYLKSSKSPTGAKADDLARSLIKTHGYPGIPHSLGHGIGIEVHEKPSLTPKSKDKLTLNMVFSVEPGIYLPKFGGVRIEDLVVLTKRGPQIITRANRKIIEL